MARFVRGSLGNLREARAARGPPWIQTSVIEQMSISSYPLPLPSARSFFCYAPDLHFVSATSCAPLSSEETSHSLHFLQYTFPSYPQQLLIFPPSRFPAFLLDSCIYQPSLHPIEVFAVDNRFLSSKSAGSRASRQDQST